MKKETETTETGETGDDSALVDIESLDEDYSDGSLTAADAAEAENAQAAETDSAQAEGEISDEAAASDAADAEQVTDTPGEAVLTSIPGSSGFAAEAKLSREQVRAKNKAVSYTHLVSQCNHNFSFHMSTSFYVYFFIFQNLKKNLVTMQQVC